MSRSKAAYEDKDSLEPPLKKLAISAPSDEELYSYSTQLVCFACSPVGEAVQSHDPKVSSHMPVDIRVAHTS
jgi:ubiquitin carboxyl-terminal hydrolase 5/13